MSSDWKEIFNVYKGSSKIKHPLSVIDGKKVNLKEAFSWILNYFSPKKAQIQVLDSTCSCMLMWHPRDLRNIKFHITTNDIRKNVEADYHFSCASLHYYLKPKSFDVIIYDPPYISLKNRNESNKYEGAFNYDSIPTVNDLMELTELSSLTFDTLLRNDGILITKITNFHYDGELRGSHDFIQWFNNHFHLFDEIIYRFYKNIPHLNFYKKKVAVTHTYFQIYKKKGVKN